MKFHGGKGPKKPKKKSTYTSFDAKSNNYSNNDNIIRQKKRKTNPTIYTTNPNDPRVQRYNDSMMLHTAWKGSIDNLRNVKTMKGQASAVNQVYKSKGETKKSNSAKRYYKKYMKAARKTDPAVIRLGVKNAIPERSMSKSTYEGGLIAFEYSKPVQPVVYVKPQKPTTQEEVKRKKASYKKATGKKHKTKNKEIINLKKKLGRNPTVSEYNKWMKNKK